MLDKFNAFLASLDLDKYRQKYQNIKTMEADMTRDIQALESIYRVYWLDCPSVFPNFEEYYHNYYLTDSMIEKIKQFNQKIGLCEDCLMKGIEAQIYRTWPSLITQIQAAYCCADIFERENVFQSVNLDHCGIDIQIQYKDYKVGIQIKKETNRRKIANRVPSVKEQKLVNKMYDIYYVVITNKEAQDYFYKKATLKHQAGDPKDYAYLFGLIGNSPYLIKMTNGFVIFTSKYFLDIKDDLDNFALANLHYLEG